MWLVSKISSHSSCTYWSSQLGHKSLVVCIVGNGHSQALAYCSSTKKVFACWNRLFQQMGRGRSLCQHQRQRCLQVHLEKHHMSIRSSMSDCYAQWAIVWQYCFPNILLRVKHQEPILNISLSTKQWTSGYDKQDRIECTK